MLIPAVLSVPTVEELATFTPPSSTYPKKEPQNTQKHLPVGHINVVLKAVRNVT